VHFARITNTADATIVADTADAAHAFETPSPASSFVAGMVIRHRHGHSLSTLLRTI